MGPVDILFLEPRGYLRTGFAPARDFMPSLGLMCLVSYLKRHAPQVKLEVIDPAIDYLSLDELGDIASRCRGAPERTDELVEVGIASHLLLQRESVLRRFEQDLAASGARLVALPFNLTSAYGDGAFLVRLVKQHLPQARIVVGGNHATSAGEELLRELPQIDVLVRGEGERALAELTLEVDGRPRALASIDGVIYRDERGLHATRERPVQEDLDLYPSPYDAAEEFSLSKRLALVRLFARNFSFDDTIFARMVQTSRGCPYDCEFCTNRALTCRCMRYHSVDYVAAEVALVRERFLPQLPFPVVNLADAIFTASKPRVLELERALGPLGLQFHCQTRVECVDDEVIAAMRGMGMSCVSFGIESLTPEVIRRTGKQLSRERLAALVAALHQNRIRAAATFIVGLPGDPVASMLENARAARDCGFDEAFFFPLIAVIGSEIYARLLAEVPEDRREHLGARENREWYYTAERSGAELCSIARLSEQIFRAR